MEFHPSLLSFGPGGWGLVLLKGILITISLGVATLPFGLTLGLIVALGQHSKRPWRSRLATVYTTVFRGIPELLTLYLVAFGIQRYFQLAWAAVGLEGTPELPPFITAMIALGVVLAAFSSEVWLGALNAIPKGQIEAGRAVGLSARKIFVFIVFPQLVRIALPGLGNNWMVLLKDTSLASVITLPEFMYVTARGNIMTKEPFLFFGFACLVYLALSVISMAGIRRLEVSANRGQEAR